MKINTQRIDQTHPFYQQERELRNEILLRPIGVPDYGWEMQDDISWHFVAEVEGKVVGCVVLAPLNEAKTKAQLMQMAIAENMQKKGIGRLLVLELLKFAKENSLEKITCHSRGNVVAFYEKLGFKVVGEPFEEVGILHRHMAMEVGNWGNQTISD